MSLFDKPQTTLNPIFWHTDIKHPRPQPQFREYIRTLLYKIFPKEKIAAMVFIGSNIGYQYSSTSDIDIHVEGIVNETYDTWHTVFKDFNDTPNYYPGTQHQINFFFTEYRPGPPDWENSLGAYDLINDEWLKKPIPPEIIMEIAKRKEPVIRFAEMYIRSIKKEIKSLSLSSETDDQQTTRYHLHNIYRLFKKLDEDRKTSYSIGSGSKALQDPNIIFKFVEHDPKIHTLFKQMIELKPEEFYELELEKEAEVSETPQHPSYFIYARAPREAREQLPKLDISKRNYHITLKYLGPKSPDEVAVIKNTLNKILEDKRDIALNVKDYTTFPNSDIYQAATTLPPRLKKLKEDLNTHFGSDALHPDYKPHITLTYNKQKNYPKPEVDRFAIKDIILARATSRYEPYARISKYILPERNILQRAYDYVRDIFG